MSYTINLTNGNLLVTVPDGTINTTACSQTLVGKNYAGYGQFLDDNFVHLLENAANSTAPSAPLTGQLWYNTTTGILQVYNGSAFKTLASANAQSTAPVSNSIGDLWYDTTNAQLNVWSGSAWLLVGPIYSAATGITGAVPAVILDNTATSHIVVELFVNDVIVGFISEDATFTPQTSITGFTTIRPGITLATTLLNGQSPLFQGTSTNSQALNGVSGSAFMRTDANTSTSGSITVNSSNVPTAIINAAGAGNGNIGSSSVPFNTIFATATSAKYADVAERFASDAEYAPGTVVELGGSAEITIANSELSESVFGVISTRAAYLMNGGAGSDLTHPPVAMTGRVPVQVIGIIKRGDRLVSAGNGVARSAKTGEATAFNVIGRSLDDKLDSGLGTVEAIVTIK
jgi:hypothetical protein